MSFAAGPGQSGPGVVVNVTDTTQDGALAQHVRDMADAFMDAIDRAQQAGLRVTVEIKEGDRTGLIRDVEPFIARPL